METADRNACRQCKKWGTVAMPFPIFIYLVIRFDANGEVSLLRKMTSILEIKI